MHAPTPGVKVAGYHNLLFPLPLVNVSFESQIIQLMKFLALHINCFWTSVDFEDV